jgi:peptidoglycan-associated lipoprotein
MNLKKWMQVIVVAASVAALAGCASKHKSQDELAINDANSAYSDESDAQSSGLGDDSGIADSTPKRHAANGKVYYFDFDSNVVRDQDKPAIIAHAQKLASQPHAKVMLEGHTDPRGSREYNIGLGERRAKSVAQIMTAKGASKHQIRIVSYGARLLICNSILCRKQRALSLSFPQRC